MRCPDCNKFVSFSEGELTVDSIDATGTEVTVEATASLNCMECGTELKSGNVSDTKDFEADVQACAEYEAKKPEAKGAYPAWWNATESKLAEGYSLRVNDTEENAEIAEGAKKAWCAVVDLSAAIIKDESDEEVFSPIDLSIGIPVQSADLDEAV